MRNGENVIHHGGFRDPEAAARKFINGCIPSQTAEESAASVLRILADTAQNLIDLLDELHGDPDQEPWLGWTDEGLLVGSDDAEMNDDETDHSNAEDEAS